MRRKNPQPFEPFLPVVVRCNRCQEEILGKIHLYNDLSIDYENHNQYHCRKMLMGQQRCFQQVEVNFTFDSKRKLLVANVSGGELLSPSV